MGVTLCHDWKMNVSRLSHGRPLRWFAGIIKIYYIFSGLSICEGAGPAASDQGRQKLFRGTLPHRSLLSGLVKTERESEETEEREINSRDGPG